MPESRIKRSRFDLFGFVSLPALPDLSATAALAAMNGRVTEQATMTAYNNVFRIMFILSIACSPLAILFRKVRLTQNLAAAPE